jgi:2-C-methyl-D-erythritol 2,4-cyclodiphosphate synthase
MTEYRVGIGFDAHALAPGRPLVLAGVDIPSDRGLVGHSDSDVLAHAVTDALLGAAGGEDIGSLFPSDDPALAGASSIDLLARAWAELAAAGWQIVNVDVVVAAEEPRLAPHVRVMADKLATAIRADPGGVSVKPKRAEGLGAIGRAEGIAAWAVVLLER